MTRSFSQAFSIISLGESPDGMMVVDDPTGDVMSEPIIGSDGTQWSLSLTTTTPYQVVANGVIDGTTSNAIQLIYHNEHVYQRNKANNWFVKKVIGDNWTSVPDPRPGIIQPNYPTFTVVASPPSYVLSPHIETYIFNCDLTLIFWGAGWNTATSPSAADISSNMATFVSSPYLSGLQEYGLFAKPVIRNTVFTSAPYPADISTSATDPTSVSNAITAMFDNGTLQLPITDEHQYMFVMLPVANPTVGGFNYAIPYKGFYINASVNFNFGTLPITLGIMVHEFTEGLVDRFHYSFLPFLKNGAGGFLEGNWHGSTGDQQHAGQIEDVAHDPVSAYGTTVDGFFSDRVNAVILPSVDTAFPAGLPTPRVYTTAPPLNIFLNTITATTILFTWNIPDGFTFGTTYTYTIEYRRLCDVSWIIQSFTAANNSFTLTGLQPYTAYLVRMTFQGGRPMPGYTYCVTTR